jgi:expansin (peptidoglycan-binding protein)
MRAEEELMRGVIVAVVALTIAGCDEDLSRPDGRASDGPHLERGVTESGVVPDGPHPADGTGPRDGAPRPPDGGKPKDQGSPFTTVSGKATYYNADGSGNCGFPATPNDLMVGAMNDPDYLGSQVCGECVEVTGPKATIVIRIVDRCPECLHGHIDLSQQAFAKIADLALGVVPITWRVVACNVTGPIVYHFKEGSNQWWSAIQLRNIRYPVKSLEAQVSGSFKALPRETYNYFVYSSGLGPGPYTLRVTDVLGHVLTDTNIPFKEAQDVPGAAQLPP